MQTGVGESDHLLLPCALSVPGKAQSLKSVAMVDSGATANFVGKAFVKRHRLPLHKLPKERRVKLANPKTPVKPIKYYTEFEMLIGRHYETVRCYVLECIGHDLILGIHWLRTHNVAIDWAANTATFHPDSCQHYLPCREPITIRGLRRLPPTADRNEVVIDGVSMATISIQELCQELESEDCEALAVIWPRENNQETGEEQSLAECNVASAEDYEKFMKGKKATNVRDKLPKRFWHKEKVFSRPDADKLPPHREEDHEIRLEEGSKLPPHKKGYNMSRDQLAATRKYVDEALAKHFIRPSKSPVASPAIIVGKGKGGEGGLRFCIDYRALNAVTVKNRYPIPQMRETFARLCKAKYYTKLDIIAAFHNLRVKEGHEWLTAFSTRYGQFEYQVMPFGLCNAPGTFQSFINKQLQDILDIFCTAYLDDILIFSETLEEHHKHVETVLDRLEKAGLYVDIDKSEFYVQKVKYLGLIITTDGLQMDPDKVKTILEWQTPTKLKELLAFLGFANFYRVFIEEFSRIAYPLTDLTKGVKKEKTIRPRSPPPAPRPPGRSRSSRRRAKQLKVPFVWTPECEIAFNTLKSKFAAKPVLAFFDPDEEAWVEVDASDWVTAGVFSQMKNGILRPIAYFSRKMNPHECNYEIYDKELLAIVRAFEEWRPELMSVLEPVKVFSDHRSLEYFMTTKDLTQRQARWSEFLSQFNFRIQYRPGRQGTKPDSLTRRPGDLPTSADDERRQHRQQVVLKPANLGEGILPPQAMTAAVALAEVLLANDTELDVAARVKEAYQQDPVTKTVIEALNSDARQLPAEMNRHLRISLADCSIDAEGHLRYKNKMWVPNDEQLRLAIFQEVHDSAAVGHPGKHGTYSLVQRDFYWPGMPDDSRKYVKGCHTCRRNKAFRDAYNGTLSQLPVPKGAWEDIAMDYVVQLPPSLKDGVTYTNILVVTDRLTKFRHFIPAEKTDSLATAKLLFDHVWKLHGFPVSMVSDRGKQFISDTWQHLCDRAGVKNVASTAYHPETDGQSENSNQGMEQYLRIYTNYLQTDWVSWLPSAEFAANNHVSETTKMSPFFAVFGRHPRYGSLVEAKLDLRIQPRDAQTMQEFVQYMNAIHGFLQEQMVYSQAQYEKFSNRHRRPAPVYKVGDYVWLDLRNYDSERPAKKLDQKNGGPYKVIQIVSSSAYKLQLDEQSKVHNVFHTSVLRPVTPDSEALPGQAAVREPPPPQIIKRDDSEETEWDVDDIVDSKIKWGSLRYKVQWTGRPADWRRWDSVLPGCDDVIRAFHLAHPDKPGPPTKGQYDLGLLAQEERGTGPKRPSRKK